jgi:AcrR family transcriptional regulator
MPSVTRKSHGNRAKRRDDVRRRLLAVVEELLTAGESYAEISVERLVSEAKLSRSTFYVYFEDKGDLLRAWFEQVIEELDAAAGAWWKLDGTATPADLRAALAQIVNTYRPHTTLMAALYDMSSYDSTVREEVATMMSRNSGGLRRHIQRGQKQGWIDPDLLPAETAAWLTWMAERGQHQMVRLADDAEVEKLIDAYADVVWNSLYAFAPARNGGKPRGR